MESHAARTVGVPEQCRRSALSSTLCVADPTIDKLPASLKAAKARLVDALILWRHAYEREKRWRPLDVVVLGACTRQFTRVAAQCRASRSSTRWRSCRRSSSSHSSSSSSSSSQRSSRRPAWRRRLNSTAWRARRNRIFLCAFARFIQPAQRIRIAAAAGATAPSVCCRWPHRRECFACTR